MHMMLAGVVDLDRQERAGADMQGQVGKPDPAGCQCRDQCWREMQAGGRCGDRTLLAGEDRLIIAAVARIAARAGA